MIRFDLSGRSAIVTGAARGIGLGIAQRLSDAGAAVAVWDRDPGPLQNTQSVFRPAWVETVDISDWDSVERARDSTLAQLPKIDILINNAGVNGPTVPTWDYPVDAWRKVIDTDLTGVFLCCRSLARHMAGNGYGRIVNIASIAGKEGNANASAYAAAKAGVIAFTKALGKELVSSGVLVNCIAPAMVETDLLAEMTPEYIADIKSRIPMGRFGTIKENADMVAWLCSEECSFTTASVFDVSGGRATY